MDDLHINQGISEDTVINAYQYEFYSLKHFAASSCAPYLMGKFNIRLLTPPTRPHFTWPPSLPVIIPLPTIEGGKNNMLSYLEFSPSVEPLQTCNRFLAMKCCCNSLPILSKFIKWVNNLRWTKLPKIQVSAENFVRQKILFAENFPRRNFVR